MSNSIINPVGLSLFRQIEYRKELFFRTNNISTKMADYDVLQLRRFLSSSQTARFFFEKSEMFSLDLDFDAHDIEDIFKQLPYPNLIIEMESDLRRNPIFTVMSVENRVIINSFAVSGDSYYVEPFWIIINGGNFYCEFAPGVNEESPSSFKPDIANITFDIRSMSDTLAAMISALNSRVNKTKESGALSRTKKRSIKSNLRAFFETKKLIICPEFYDEQLKFRQELKTDRAPVRFHTRRGHFRRLSTGKMIFVKSTTVGSPENGVLDKSYEFKSQVIAKHPK